MGGGVKKKKMIGSRKGRRRGKLIMIRKKREEKKNGKGRLKRGNGKGEDIEKKMVVNNKKNVKKVDWPMCVKSAT